MDVITLRFISKRYLAFFIALLTSLNAYSMQPILVEVKPESDGTYTYQYKIKTDHSVMVKGGSIENDADFFTLFNFGGMVEGSAKQPTGWSFSSSTQGLTPFRTGRTVLNPFDINGVPNVTWTRTGTDLKTASEISGFSVRSVVKEAMLGEYGVQVTRIDLGKLKHKFESSEEKEARLGYVWIPKLLKTTRATR